MEQFLVFKVALYMIAVLVFGLALMELLVNVCLKKSFIKEVTYLFKAVLVEAGILKDRKVLDRMLSDLSMEIAEIYRDMRNASEGGNEKMMHEFRRTLSIALAKQNRLLRIRSRMLEDNK